MKKLAGIIAIPVLALSLAACGASKPSKEEVTKGLAQGFEKVNALGGVGKEKAGDITGCVADKIYDKVSDKTLQIIAEGDDSKEVPAEDRKIILDDTMECSKELLMPSK